MAEVEGVLRSTLGGAGISGGMEVYVGWRVRGNGGEDELVGTYEGREGWRGRSYAWVVRNG